MTFVSVWMYNKYNPAFVLRISVSIILVGALLRSLCVYTENYWPVFVGQLVTNLGNPFFMNV